MVVLQRRQADFFKLFKPNNERAFDETELFAKSLEWLKKENYVYMHELGARRCLKPAVMENLIPWLIERDRLIASGMSEKDADKKQTNRFFQKKLG